MDLIAEYQHALARLDRSPNTVDCYVRTLRQADRELPYGLASASTEELEDWLFSGQRGKTTRSHYARTLKGFGKWATDPRRPRLDYDATADLPDLRPTKVKPKPAAEGIFADILARAHEPHVLWYYLAGYEGLRCIEISRLDREDITAERVWVRGKGDKERYVPTHRIVWDRVRGLPSGPLAVDSDGVTRLTADQVSHRGNHHIRKLGYPGTSMHTLRHRFASRAYDVSNNDIRVVQELLGHSSVGTTQRYVEVDRDRMAAAVAGLPVAV